MARPHRLGAALLLAYLLGRSRRRAPDISVAERLGTIPARGAPVGEPVTIHWNDQQVPYVEAASDGDAACGLGLVHAHLRWSQMEMLRRIARGRLAEMIGPAGIELDHALLALDLTRAVPAIDAALPAATRAWIERFVDGVNHHVAHAPALPPELALFDMPREPWTLRDVLSIGRVAAADVNWLLWLKLLRLRRRPDWPKIWDLLLRDGAMPTPTPGEPAATEPLGALFAQVGRFASNAVAVGRARSKTGAAWVAGDTHLSIVLPNLWLIAAWRSPSYNVVGLMIPGLPMAAVGRNPWLAWGGTNLHAASSDLFDVAGEAAVQPERTLRIPVRWSRARQRRVRESRAGPVISDAPLFGGGATLGFRWIGHRPSDEFSAILAVNRARDGTTMLAALDGFAVPGQNFVYADRAGQIGAAAAAWLPRRPGVPSDLVLPPARLGDWDDIAVARGLPRQTDPPAGFVVSANDRPSDMAVPIGWFFSPADRAARLADLLQRAPAVGFTTLRALHLDVCLPAVSQLKRLLVHRLRAQPNADRAKLASLLERWDGTYDAGSAGALAYELLVYHIAAALPAERRALVDAVWHGRTLLRGDVAGMTEQNMPKLDRAVRRTVAGLRRFGSWGALHRLRLVHPLAALPLVGRRFRFADRPADGTSDTLLKTAHPFTARRHAVRYGSNARYIFDLSQPDGNHFALLGGQDGWIGSASFLDQLPLWERGAYVQVPLAVETVRRLWPHRTRVTPP